MVDKILIKLRELCFEIASKLLVESKDVYLEDIPHQLKFISLLTEELFHASIEVLAFSGCNSDQLLNAVERILDVNILPMISNTKSLNEQVVVRYKVALRITIDLIKKGKI